MHLGDTYLTGGQRRINLGWSGYNLENNQVKNKWCPRRGEHGKKGPAKEGVIIIITTYMFTFARGGTHYILDFEIISSLLPSGLDFS